MAKATKSYIQNTLRKYRILAGYSQREVARLLGHSNPSRISQWENGKCLPSADNLFVLSILYKQPVEILFSYHIQKIGNALFERQQELFPHKASFVGLSTL